MTNKKTYDHFAAFAMHAIITTPEYMEQIAATAKTATGAKVAIAIDAYSHAKAMMVFRKKFFEKPDGKIKTWLKSMFDKIKLLVKKGEESG